MRRLLIFVTVLYVVWRVLGIFGRRQRRREEFDRRVRTGDRSATGVGDRKLVACSRCGTLVPEDRAFRGPDGTPYCERSCLEAGGGSGKGVGDGEGALPPAAPQA